MTKILVVDDDRVSRKIVVDHLRDEGYTFEEAEDGREMVKRVDRDPPDLILLDIEMPCLDGVSACRILQESPITNNIPVIIMTATNNADKIGQCFTALDAGAERGQGYNAESPVR